MVIIEDVTLKIISSLTIICLILICTNIYWVIQYLRIKRKMGNIIKGKDDLF